MEEIIRIFKEKFPLGSASQQQLTAILQQREAQKNDIIQAPGSQCRTLYFVVEGIARIYYFQEADEVTEHFAFSGDMIIRAESLFTGQPTAKGIQAVTDVKLIAIAATPLFELFKTNHEIERLFNKIFIDAYVATVRRVESLQFKSATERYLDLAQHTDWIKQIPLKYIASYLGITQVSLSRIRSQIRQV